MGKTLLELFKGSPKDINPRQVDKAPYSDDESKEIDGRGLYYKDDLYKYGTNYSKVKSDKETFIEQETSGIRVRSAVELNNPLIYGNEAIRIVNRTTSAVEDMKSATGGSEGDSGLIGKGLDKLSGGKVTSISSARNEFNKALKIPITPIPSRVITEVIDSNPNSDKEGSKIPSSTPITKELYQDGSSEFGKLLKETGGGNPKTIAKQALGKGIGYAKDELRGKLFGGSGTIGEALGDNNGFLFEWSDQNTYSSFMTDTSKKVSRDIYNEGGEIPSSAEPALPFGNQSNTKIDLRLTSPIYGVSRRRYGNTPYAYTFFESTKRKGESLPQYTPDSPKLGYGDHGKQTPLESEYGIGKSDTINLLKSSDYDTVDDNGVYKKGENKVGEDLIPFYIGKFGEKKTPFRAIITGLNESVSPSWSTNKMVGNPFPYYTYNQIERNTSFTLKIYCNSPLELATNWEKIEVLTKMTYPKVNQNNLVNPPIIQFRLGDIYFDKIGFIESLTYTIPDNSTWETDGTLGFLPKYIEASITIKFIEDVSVLNALYGYKKSKAAIEKIKEDNNSKDFSESNRTGIVEVGQGQFGEFGTDGNFGDGKITVNTRGIKDLTTGPTAGQNIPNKKSNKLNSLTPKVIAKTSTPIEADSGTDDLLKIQSSVSDKLGGKTISEAIKSEESSSITPAQAEMITKLKVAHKVDIIKKSQLDSTDSVREDGKWANSVFVKTEMRFGTTWRQIAPDGEMINIKRINSDSIDSFPTVNQIKIQNSDTLYGLTKPN